MKRTGFYATRCIIAGLTLGLLAVASASAQEITLRLNRVDSFIPHFSVKREMNAAYRPELDRILATMHRRMRAGENMSCTAQIFEEVHWLVNYTDRAGDIERRLQDLRDSLAMADQSFAARQDPADGSFAPCIEDWLWRFFRSVDPLKELAHQGIEPEVALKIWEPVDTPEELTAYMRDLLVSELDSGHNKRKELNLAVTALGQLLWLDYTDRVFPAHLDRAALAEALRRFVDEEWQDPETGYWGAWFDDEGTIRKTQDLSMTFHIISYRGGAVDRLREIGQTTMAIKEIRYPFGWDTGGTQNNHHAYDIARLVNLTWSELDAASRAHAAAQLFLMSARSLAFSIDTTGAFDPSGYTTVAEAYYFGVSFFEEIGLFGNPVPRTTMTRMVNTERLFHQIEDNLSQLDPADPWVAATERKLDGLREQIALGAN